MTTVNSFEQFHAAGQTPERPRTKYTFTIPPTTGSEVEKIVLVELETYEEVMAAKRSGNDPLVLSMELAKEAFRGIQMRGGSMQRLSTGDGTAEAAFARLDSKARTLLTSAYSNIHSPLKSEGEAFLASCVTEV
jgi:hypothetical protein